MGMPFPPPCAPWIPPNSAGIFGPRPGIPQQAYPVMLPDAPSPTPAPPASYGTPPLSWDASALNHAAPSYGTAFSPHAAEWIMDTGAALHVSGDPGSSHQGSSSEMQQ
ncbi:uncharacterized protein LOC119330581 [Triticum dicoccoides]|uniref:uncharacterized protein LOC119330581 n=1 Tax=Triticum dicoccoides TaxID=85692 RepID=UPI00189108DD|nr:uncharacterized protein LOC119330581 [Triticum dicoccoides]